MGYSPDPDTELYRVLLKRGEFIDDARAGRAVPYKIYYPVLEPAEKVPLIIWSHGFGGNRDGASFISRYLASQGYVVAHLSHHGTDSTLWEGKPGHPWDILRKVEIPRSATLDRMHDVPFFVEALKAWAANTPEIGAITDFDIIGMSGHSFGAMTTQVMAGMIIPSEQGELSAMAQPFFKAGILYSPVPIPHLTESRADELRAYGEITMPLLHMTGTEDASPLQEFGYKERLSISENSPKAESYVHVLDGGDHMIYNGTRGKLKDNPLRGGHEAEIKITALAFWDYYLKGNDAARAVLLANTSHQAKKG